MKLMKLMNKLLDRTRKDLTILARLYQWNREVVTVTPEQNVERRDWTGYIMLEEWRVYCLMREFLT